MSPHLLKAKKSIAFWLTAVNQPRDNAVKHSGPASPMTPVKGRLLVPHQAQESNHYDRA
jgi:hypothetical protein